MNSNNAIVITAEKVVSVEAVLMGVGEAACFTIHNHEGARLISRASRKWRVLDE